MQYLLQLFVEFIGLFQFFTVVDQFERGVILRFGKFNRVINPGLHFMLPLNIDKAITHEVVMTARETDEQSLTTNDGKKIVVSTLVVYTLEDIRKILLEVEEAETVLENYAYGVITELVTENDLEYVLSSNFQVDYFNNITPKAKNPPIIPTKIIPVFILVFLLVI